TTYTLTATGLTAPPTPGKPQPTGTITRTVTVTVAGTQPVAAGASESVVPLTERPTPRALDGKPDLSGVYGFGQGAGRGAPPPAPAPGVISRTPTLKPGADKYRVVRGPEDPGLYSSCRPPGVP